MSSIQSSALYAIGIALVGFIILSLVGDLNIPGNILFAAGLFLGGIFVQLLTNKKQTTQTRNTKTIYVGNLPYRANESAIRQLFSQYGVVQSVRLLKDKQTGKRRGFGFVEMNSEDADSAIKALNDSEFQQRTLKVREAKERQDKPETTQLQSES